MRRLKILAIAYACNPMRGSEFAVGWGWVSAIAARHDVTVLTADFNSSDIDSYLNQYSGSDRTPERFIYVKNRPWHYRPQGIWLKIEDSPAKPVMNMAYLDWLRYANAEAGRQVQQKTYDLVHLVTYVGWRFPGSFYQLGIPFVWGPIGGMMNTPWRLLPLLGFKGAFYYAARNVINSIQIATLQKPRRALRAAGDGVIAATAEIRQRLWQCFRTKSHVICEVGPPEIHSLRSQRRSEDSPFKICWSGMHLPGKALHLLLRAAVRMPREFNYTIEILGDGPCNRKWRSLARRLKIEDRCHWHGWISRDQSLAVMASSHVFAITSLKDLTSTVAVEAVSLGLPVICLDHCGFADLITGECGIKVYPGRADQIIADIASALSTLYQDEDFRCELSQGALQRCREYAWTNKMTALDRVYGEVMRRQNSELKTCVGFYH